MFDIGFWELSLLALVALLVVGPERLPKLARTAGLWIGRRSGPTTRSATRASRDNSQKPMSNMD